MGQLSDLEQQICPFMPKLAASLYLSRRIVHLLTKRKPKHGDALAAFADVAVTEVGLHEGPEKYSNLSLAAREI